MHKTFDAYYSPQWAWIYSFLSAVFALAIALFVLFLFLFSDSLFLLILLPLLIVLSFFCIFLFSRMYRKTKQQTGIAAEIVDDVLILYKKETVSIPLNEIQRIDIHDGHGSFDLIVKTAGKRIQFHCFIEDQIEKKRQLIRYLKSKSINVQTYDLVD